jgi:hypothetical protein
MVAALRGLRNIQYKPNGVTGADFFEAVKIG